MLQFDDSCYVDAKQYHLPSFSTRNSTLNTSLRKPIRMEDFIQLCDSTGNSTKESEQKEIIAWQLISKDCCSEVKKSTNRFHVAVRLFSNRSQMTSKCGKNKKVAHEAKLAVAVNLEAIRFEFWMKGALVTVEICVLCGWWFTNQSEIVSKNLLAAIQSAVSDSELYFASYCPLKRTGTFAKESKVMCLF